MIAIFSAPADEGGPQAYAKELLLNRNLFLESLTAVNKGSSTVYVQLFNSARKLAVPITDSSVGDTSWTVDANHGFVTGDAVTLTGPTGGPFTGYLRNIDSTTFSLHDTRADALSGDNPVAPPNDNEIGELDLTSNKTSAPVAEEYPLLAAANAPSNVFSLTNAKFGKGLYVRAVTAINGSTLIGAADVKFTPRYRTYPITNAVTYAD